jgi:hypothetical protein
MKQKSRYQHHIERLLRSPQILVAGVLNLLWILAAILLRLLRAALGVVYLPAALAGGFLLGYFVGPTCAPWVMDCLSGTFLDGLTLETLERLCRWSAAISLMAVGGIGYQRHQQLSRLRLQHEFTYQRYQEIIGTPGSRLTDFLWAYSTAFVLVNVPVGLMVAIVFVAPFFITENWLFRVLLIFFLMSGMGSFLNGAAVVLLETFKPRRLEAELQEAGRITPRLEREHQRYTAQKESRQRMSDKELREDDW